MPSSEKQDNDDLFRRTFAAELVQEAVQQEEAFFLAVNLTLGAVPPRHTRLDGRQLEWNAYDTGWQWQLQFMEFALRAGRAVGSAAGHTQLLRRYLRWYDTRIAVREI